MHLEAIDNDLWYVVENGVPSITPAVNAADVKRFKQLNSQAKNIICGHLSKGQCGIVSALETANLIRDRLSKVSEGISTQCDSRVDVLCNLFSHFERLDNKMFTKLSIVLLISPMSSKLLVLPTSPTTRW